MEPRLLSRGDSPTATVSPSASDRNGAAASQPRRRSANGDLSALMGYRNGAAASQPRRPSTVHRTLAGRARRKAPQWSRGFSAAETVHDGSELPEPPAPQWSRGFSAAETAVNGVAAGVEAEHRNGAAASQPRRRRLLYSMGILHSVNVLLTTERRAPAARVLCLSEVVRAGCWRMPRTGQSARAEASAPS